MFFYFLFSIFYFLVAWFKPRWALFLICALLPTYQLRFQIFGLPTTLLEVMIVALFIVWLIRQLSNSTIKQLNKSLGNWRWLILAWLVVGLLATVVSPDKFGAFGYWRAYFLEPILLLLVVINIAAGDSKTRIHANDTNTSSITSNTSTSYNTLTTVLYGLSISALICSLWAIGQKIFGGGMLSIETWTYPLKSVWRSTGPFPQSNFLGMFLGPLTVLFLSRLIEALKNKKLLVIGYWLLVIIASILAIISAKSEGAIVGIIAGLIFFFIVYFKTRKWTIFILAILIFFIFTLSIICVNPRSDLSSVASAKEDLRQSALCASRVSTYVWTKIKFQDISSQLRLNIWQGTIKLIEAHPIFGAGLRGYQKLALQFQKPFYLLGISQPISDEIHPYPHNLFLALWAELGIFGLIVFLVIIFQFFKLGLKSASWRIVNCKLSAKGGSASGGKIENSRIAGKNKILIVAILSAMVAMLVHGLVDTPYFKNDLSILFWLIIGLLIIETKEQLKPE